MGYHVQILRSSHGNVDPITRAEIEALVSSTSGLRIEESRSKAAELELIISREGQDISWLTLQRGELWTKNPEDDELQAMIAVAERLHARVRGDELETYRTITDTYVHPDDKLELDRAKKIDAHALRKYRSKK